MTTSYDCHEVVLIQKAVIEAFNDCLLEQMVTSPTRCQNILDLFLTSNPTLIDKTIVLPGLSDHGIVQVELMLSLK